MITRRFFSGILLASPAIIRTPGLLMPIKPWPLRYNEEGLSYLQRVIREYGQLPVEPIPPFLTTFIDPSIITLLTKRNEFFLDLVLPA
jgi:hypothetical protein